MKVSPGNARGCRQGMQGAVARECKGVSPGNARGCRQGTQGGVAQTFMK